RSFCRTSDLMRSTGVTRQRIAQILRQWEANGTVRRVIEPGTTLRFLWALPGVPYDPGYRPAVAPSRLRLASLAMILSCLRPAAFHRPARLARHLGLSVYAVLPVVRQLEHAGLVRTTRV